MKKALKLKLHSLLNNTLFPANRIYRVLRCSRESLCQNGCLVNARDQLINNRFL